MAHRVQGPPGKRLAPPSARASPSPDIPRALLHLPSDPLDTVGGFLSMEEQLRTLETSKAGRTAFSGAVTKLMIGWKVVYGGDDVPFDHLPPRDVGTLVQLMRRHAESLEWLDCDCKNAAPVLLMAIGQVPSFPRLRFLSANWLSSAGEVAVLCEYLRSRLAGAEKMPALTTLDLSEVKCQWVLGELGRALARGGLQRLEVLALPPIDKFGDLNIIARALEGRQLHGSQTGVRLAGIKQLSGWRHLSLWGGDDEWREAAVRLLSTCWSTLQVLTGDVDEGGGVGLDEGHRWGASFCRAVGAVLSAKEASALLAITIHEERAEDEIRAEDIEPVLAALAKGRAPSLQRLGFARFPLNEAGIDHLARAIRRGSFKGLRELELARLDTPEPLLPALLQAVAAAPGSLAALRALTIADEPSLHVETARALARLVEAGALPNLESLQLHNCPIRDAGYQALCTALQQGPCAGALRVLSVDKDCKITAASLRHLITLLGQGGFPALERADGLDRVGARNIHGLLARNLAAWGRAARRHGAGNDGARPVRPRIRRLVKDFGMEEHVAEEAIEAMERRG